jgi:hypothetical protein
VVYLFNTILFSDTKEWNTNNVYHPCYNMDEAQKECAKAPDTKGHIVYNSIHTKCLE